MSPRDVDWDAEWLVAWKAHRKNAWFGYQADVYARWLADGGAPPPRRLLKTDAFDEACGFRPLGDAAAVLMDVSPRILRAARDGGHARLVATDVRRLAVRAGAFDVVFSPSSLDHFDDVRDIEAALRELHHALAPGGRLLLTLDNPANPVLRARAMVHWLAGRVGGLIPFAMGRTLERRRLRDLLARCGFDVVRIDYCIHVPRVVGLWLGEWAARRGDHDRATRLRTTLGQLERVGTRLPIRRWTGHFVVADCRRRER
jgi:SAM-dependent methyltransferase